MDIQAYISSGILDLYVLAQLSAKENQEVEAIRAKYPEVEKEIERLEITLEKYAFEHEKAPSEELKKKILAKIQQEGKKQQDSNILPLQTKSNWIYNFAIAASFLLFASTIVLAYSLWTNNQATQTILAENQKQLKGIQQELVILKNPSYRHIQLNSTDSTKQQSALVFWNPKSQEVYLQMGLLPVLPSDKQYQLWAIIDGKPTDMGVFETVADLQKMKVAPNPQAFAITIEPKGGSLSPTLSAMVVLGKV